MTFSRSEIAGFGISERRFLFFRSRSFSQLHRVTEPEPMVIADLRHADHALAVGPVLPVPPQGALTAMRSTTGAGRLVHLTSGGAGVTQPQINRFFTHRQAVILGQLDATAEYHRNQERSELTA